MWGWRFTLPKWELGSLRWLPKLQREIARAKTPRIEEFFISLERYWNVDVWNGFTLPIWTSIVQVMTKRKAKSQTGSLTLDHKKLGFDLTPVCAGGVWHAVEKLSMRAITLFQTSSDRWYEQIVIVPQSCGSLNFSSFVAPPWESRDKKPFKCRRRGEARRILYGGRWWLPPSSSCGESCESKIVRGLS
jgi:hypothetical protein